MTAAWIGPAIVAAIISAAVTGMGWFVSERQTSRREALRRRERKADMQIALLAEIRASQHRSIDLSSHGAMVDRRMADDDAYLPFVPRQVEAVIYGAFLGDLHLLPSQVIDPVVIYYRQLAVTANLAEDLRSERYALLDRSRQRVLYNDFVSLTEQADALAADAEIALSRALNMTVVGSSALRSASGSAGAEGQDEASRSNS